MKKKYWQHLTAVSIVLFMFFAALAAAAEERKPARQPDVHFVPTPTEIVEIMLRLADVSKDDVVYDLGCGDGRIVIAAAEKAGARAYGFDIDPEMVDLSIENVKEKNLEDLVTIQEKDIFELDLSGASVVTLYLLPDLNVRLIPQLKKLKPGARIVSHVFDMAGIQPDVEATVHLRGGHSAKVYLWTTPLREIGEYPFSDIGEHVKKIKEYDF